MSQLRAKGPGRRLDTTQHMLRMGLEEVICFVSTESKCNWFRCLIRFVFFPIESKNDTVSEEKHTCVSLQLANKDEVREDRGPVVPSHTAECLHLMNRNASLSTSYTHASHQDSSKLAHLGQLLKSPRPRGPRVWFCMQILPFNVCDHIHFFAHLQLSESFARDWPRQ